MSTEQPETIAAILAEMRDFAKPLRVGGDLCSNVAAPATISIWADRIEAAAERERDEDRQLAAIAESDEAFARCARCDRPERTPGNAAAMRDALEEISARIKQEIEQPIPGNDPTGGIAMCEMEVIANAALAAPARNADRFQTLDDFSMADSPIDTPLTNATREQLYKVIRWLFAPAEGGAE